MLKLINLLHLETLQIFFFSAPLNGVASDLKDIAIIVEASLAVSIALVAMKNQS